MSFKNFQALGSQTLIRPKPLIDETIGGIYIPDIYREERYKKGEILAIGPGKIVKEKRRPTGLNVGDIVLFPVYKAYDIKVNKESLIVIDADEILAVLE